MNGERPAKRAQKKPLSLGAKAVIVLLVLDFGAGIYTGVNLATEAKPDTASIVEVQTGQTVWDIARPVADARGADIREVLAQIQSDNGLDDNFSVRPGQKLVVK